MIGGFSIATAPLGWHSKLRKSATGGPYRPGHPDHRILDDTSGGQAQPTCDWGLWFRDAGPAVARRAGSSLAVTIPAAPDMKSQVERRGRRWFHDGSTAASAWSMEDVGGHLPVEVGSKLRTTSWLSKLLGLGLCDQQASKTVVTHNSLPDTAALSHDNLQSLNL
jgi:hypothetical protein